MTPVLSCQSLHTVKQLGDLNHFTFSPVMKALAEKPVLKQLLRSLARTYTSPISLFFEVPYRNALLKSMRERVTS